MQEFLKVKVQTLAAEARIIRKQEAVARRAREWAKGWRPKQIQGGERQPRVPNGTEVQIEQARALVRDLADHRKTIVRPEARSSCLAYGFLKGNDYAAMEGKVHNKAVPDFKRIEYLVTKYSGLDPRVVGQGLAAWVDQAKAHLRVQYPGLI